MLSNGPFKNYQHGSTGQEENIPFLFNNQKLHAYLCTPWRSAMFGIYNAVVWPQRKNDFFFFFRNCEVWLRLIKKSVFYKMDSWSNTSSKILFRSVMLLRREWSLKPSMGKFLWVCAPCESGRLHVNRFYYHIDTVVDNYRRALILNTRCNYHLRYRYL